MIIKADDSPKEIQKKIDKLNAASISKRKKKLQSLFGKLKLDQDPLELQKKWREEND